MKTIYLILIVLGLIFGGLSIISGNAILVAFCFPSYIEQLTIFLGGGMTDFGVCGR